MMKFNFVFMFTLLANMASAQTPLPNDIESVKNYTAFQANTASGGSLNLESAPKDIEAAGFKSIIDLRREVEGTPQAKAAFESTSVNYYNIETAAPTILSSPKLVEQFANIYENAPKPVLVQCGSGNRVGAMWAEYLIYKGEDAETAIEAGKKAGMQSYLENEMRKKYSE